MSRKGRQPCRALLGKYGNNGTRVSPNYRNDQQKAVFLLHSAAIYWLANEYADTE